MMTRRAFLYTTTVGAGATSLLSAPGAVFAREGKVVFITPFKYLLSFAPVMVAAGAGFFAKQGLDVEVIGGSGSAQAVQQVLSGQALIGRTGGVNTMIAVAKGAPVKSFATIAQGSPFYVMSAQSDPVNSPKDMVGAVVGLVSKGGATENLLDAMLIKEGIDPSSVQRRYTGDNPGAYGLLETGRLKAFVGNVGTMLKAKKAGAKIIAWNTHKYAPIPGQVYVATNDTIAKQSKTLVAFLKGVDEAIRFIMKDGNLDAVIKALSKFPVQGLGKPDLVKSVLAANAELWTLEGKENVLRNIPENWEKGVELAVKAGFAKPVDPKALYTNELVEKAKA